VVPSLEEGAYPCCVSRRLYLTDTLRAYLLREEFVDRGSTQTMRARQAPMEKVPRMLRWQPGDLFGDHPWRPPRTPR